MIIRKKKVPQNADEVSCKAAFTLGDVKAACRHLYQEFSFLPQFPTMTWSRDEIIHVMQAKLFGWMHPKHAINFAEWAATAAIRMQYFVADPLTPDRYYLSKCFGVRATGRPREH